MSLILYYVNLNLKIDPLDKMLKFIVVYFYLDTSLNPPAPLWYRRNKLDRKYKLEGTDSRRCIIGIANFGYCNFVWIEGIVSTESTVKSSASKIHTYKVWVI